MIRNSVRVPIQECMCSEEEKIPTFEIACFRSLFLLFLTPAVALLNCQLPACHLPLLSDMTSVARGSAANPQPAAALQALCVPAVHGEDQWRADCQPQTGCSVAPIAGHLRSPGESGGNQ